MTHYNARGVESLPIIGASLYPARALHLMGRAADLHPQVPRARAVASTWVDIFCALSADPRLPEDTTFFIFEEDWRLGPSQDDAFLGARMMATTSAEAAARMQLPASLKTTWKSRAWLEITSMVIQLRRAGQQLQAEGIHDLEAQAVGHFVWFSYWNPMCNFPQGVHQEVTPGHMSLGIAVSKQALAELEALFRPRGKQSWVSEAKIDADVDNRPGVLSPTNHGASNHHFDFWVAKRLYALANNRRRALDAKSHERWLLRQYPSLSWATCVLPSLGHFVTHASSCSEVVRRSKWTSIHWIASSWSDVEESGATMPMRPVVPGECMQLPYARGFEGLAIWDTAPEWRPNVLRIPLTFREKPSPWKTALGPETYDLQGLQQFKPQQPEWEGRSVGECIMGLVTTPRRPAAKGRAGPARNYGGHQRPTHSDARNERRILTQLRLRHLVLPEACFLVLLRLSDCYVIRLAC